jgi:hypothetical protein
MGRINVAYAIFEGPLGPNKSRPIVASGKGKFCAQDGP